MAGMNCKAWVDNGYDREEEKKGPNHAETKSDRSPEKTEADDSGIGYSSAASNCGTQ